MRLPEQFCSRMKEMLGEEAYQDFLSSYDVERAQGLRANTLKIEPPDLPSRVPFALTPVPWTDCGYFFEAALSAAGPETQEDPAAGDRSSAGPAAVTGVPVHEDGTTRPGKHPFHEAGVFYIQEPSAMTVAALTPIHPGEKVLDLCAAPGGKSTQAAGKLMGRGLLVSNEINNGRARILSSNIERMGVPNAIVTNEPSENLAAHFPSFFDRVIVDAPCSGEGMFKKEEDAVTMWSPENVQTCQNRQADILTQAAKMVKPGGTLTYSTCTFAPKEDEEAVAWFLTMHPEFHLVDLSQELGSKRLAWGFDTGCPDWCSEDVMGVRIPDHIRARLAGTIRLFPHHMKGEGHFVALMEKEGTLHVEPCQRDLTRKMSARTAPSGKGRQDAGSRKGRDKGRGDRSSGAALSLPQAQDLFAAFAAETLKKDVALDRAANSASDFLLFGDELYLEPYGLSLAGLKVMRPGLHLGTLKKGRFEPSHALALSLQGEDALSTYDLDPLGREAAAYLRGESIPCDPTLKGWTLVLTGGFSLGWAKAAGGMLKNHYPKGLRRPY